MTPNACIFPGCVSTDRHWHGGFPGGYTNPADPDGPPIPFTSEPAPGVHDYHGALLERRPPSDANATAALSDATLADAVTTLATAIYYHDPLPSDAMRGVDSAKRAAAILAAMPDHLLVPRAEWERLREIEVAARAMFTDGLRKASRDALWSALATPQPEPRP